MKRNLFMIMLLLFLGMKGFAQVQDTAKNTNKTVRLNCGCANATQKIMFIIDGKIFMNNKFPGLDPKLVKNITVLKNKEAVEKYGEDAKNGVILIDVVADAKWISLATLFKKNKINGENVNLPVYYNAGQVQTDILLVNKKSKYKVSVLNSTTTQLKNDAYSGNYLSISETKD